MDDIIIKKVSSSSFIQEAQYRKPNPGYQNAKEEK
jgi:hypothetical protein